MSQTKPKAAPAARFAHLFGLGRANAAKAEGAETDEERQRREEEEASAAAAETSPETETDEERQRREEEEAAAAANGTSAETQVDDVDDDEEDEAEMRGTSAAAAARRRERARCAKIFSAPSAAARPDLAAEIAFGKYPLGANAAIQLLNQAAAGTVAPSAAASAPRKPTLDERMARVSTPAVGSGRAAARTADPDQALARQIILAGKRRRGEI